MSQTQLQPIKKKKKTNQYILILLEPYNGL